jgi:hypothetical protein
VILAGIGVDLWEIAEDIIDIDSDLAGFFL